MSKSPQSDKYTASSDGKPAARESEIRSFSDQVSWVDEQGASVESIKL